MQTQMFLDYTLPIPCPLAFAYIRLLGAKATGRGLSQCAYRPHVHACGVHAFRAMPARDTIVFQMISGFGFTASFLIQSYRFPNIGRPTGGRIEGHLGKCIVES